MEGERLASAMLTAALLASSAELTARERSIVVSLVAPFDLSSPRRAADAIDLAFHRGGIESTASGLLAPHRFSRARSQAEEWLRKGVFISCRERVRVANAGVDDIPPILFGYGPREFLFQQAAAIVNSRKPRRITAGDLWVDAVKAFFREAAEGGLAIASSCGTLSYHLVCRLARRSVTPLLLVCDDVLPFMASAEKEAKFVASWGELFPQNRTLFLSSFPPGHTAQSAERMQERDRVCLSLASRIFVVAVRRGGSMESSLQRALSRRIRMTVLVDDRPDLPTEGNAALLARRGKGTVEKRPASEIPRTRIQSASNTEPTLSRPVLMLDEWPEQGSVLIHYTRSCPGPWPGESLATYLDTILDGLPSATHTGFDTLVRILEERRIRASGKLTRDGRKVVSLTECRPGEVKDLVRWRKGLIRWSFEPYGISIDREFLEGIGAETVIYGDDGVFAALPEERKHLFQLNTAAGSNWKAEKEWRVLGDLPLDSVPRDKLTVFVAELDEARIVSERFGCRVTLAGYTCDTSLPSKK